MDKYKWDRTCMDLAYSVAEHATCLRRKVGAVISKDHRIIATGFNGAPEGIRHCTNCMRDELKIPSGQRHELSMAVHAEMNAIIQCALNGVSPEGATIYVTVTPCSMCLKALINARIKRIVIDKDIYPDKLSKRLLEESGVQLVVLNKDENTRTLEYKIDEVSKDNQIPNSIGSGEDKTQILINNTPLKNIVEPLQEPKAIDVNGILNNNDQKVYKISGSNITATYDKAPEIPAGPANRTIKHTIV